MVSAIDRFHCIFYGVFLSFLLLGKTYDILVIAWDGDATHSVHGRYILVENSKIHVMISYVKKWSHKGNYHRASNGAIDAIKAKNVSQPNITSILIM